MTIFIEQPIDTTCDAAFTYVLDGTEAVFANQSTGNANYFVGTLGKEWPIVFPPMLLTIRTKAYEWIYIHCPFNVHSHGFIQNATGLPGFISMLDLIKLLRSADEKGLLKDARKW